MSARPDPPDPYLPHRGTRDYAVTGYELDLDYAVASNRLEGRATIRAVAGAVELTRVELDLVGLRVSKAAIDGTPARWAQRREKLEVFGARPIAADAEFVVDIRYGGNPRPTPSVWGPVGWEELSDGVLVASQPCGAPTWFPCNDLASMKAPIRVACTAASPYRVVANGRLASTRVRGSKTTWVYEQVEPTSPYLATLHIGRYDVYDLVPGPVRIQAVLPADQRSAFTAGFARQVEMMETFVDCFGPYPFEAGYTVVIAADPLELPIEAQGQSIFGPNHLSRAYERLIAHELAHQWFGNSLTAATWKDIWLHEGFACYAEWLWSERSGGQPADVHARLHHDRLRALPQRLVLGDPGPRDLFDDRVYKRGALTLHAVRLEIGDGPFFELLRHWADTHRHGVVTTSLFVAAAEQVAGRGLRPLFQAWLDRPGLPHLSSPR